MARPISRAEVVRRRQEAAKNQENARKFRWIVLGFLGFFAVGGLALLVAFWGPLVRSVRHERLAASADQFLFFAGEKPAEGAAAEPHVKGKLVVMDKQLATLDPVQRHLNNDIRALSADEVGTVAWLDWDFVSTNDASGRHYGHYSQCKVTLVDRQTNQIIGEHTVMGPNSPVSKGTRYAPPGRQTAYRAESQVISYLQSLPRR